MIEPVSNMFDSYTNWECLKRNHIFYVILAFDLTSYMKNCISKVIVASNTNNYPKGSVLNTLKPGDRTRNRASYWLGEGNSTAEV